MIPASRVALQPWPFEVPLQHHATPLFSSAALLKRVHLPSPFDVLTAQEIYAGSLVDFRKPGDLS